MPTRCPRCGAEYVCDMLCEERFAQCLALEFENPAAWPVHHLTVACYMLQHNAYTRTAWLETRKMLAQFLRKGVSPAEMRRRNQATFDSGNRSWRFTRGEKPPEFAAIRWSRTIADVRLDETAIYCTDITLWAESILADSRGSR